MQTTANFQTRMNQRGLRKDLIELTLDLGEGDGDRIVLSPRAIDAEMSALQKRMKLLRDARKKGGVVVIAPKDTLVTAYRLASFNPKLS